VLSLMRMRGRTPLGHQAFGRRAFTSIVGRPVVLHEGLWPHGPHCMPGWREPGRASQRMQRRERTLTLDCGPPRGPVEGLGGTRRRASARQYIGASKPHQRCKGVTTLALPQAPLAHWAAHGGGDRGKDCAQVCVTGASRTARAWLHSTLGPFLGNGHQRRGLEGKQGPGGPTRLWEGKLGIVKTVSRQAGKTAVHHAQARNGGARLP
jgi:hypothetical protein